jgi:hypothetical protein
MNNINNIPVINNLKKEFILLYTMGKRKPNGMNGIILPKICLKAHHSEIYFNWILIVAKGMRL